MNRYQWLVLAAAWLGWGFDEFDALLFPPRPRASGAGFCYNPGRIIAALGPLAVGIVTSRKGIETMSALKLVIGNKNYSSWSLRPWMLLRHLGLAFDETVLQLDTPQFKAQIAAWSPAHRVPVLADGELRIWDSLAICEYACELAGRGWPQDRAGRARARSLAAEMHSGFAVLRSSWPMNARARNRRTNMTAELAADIARIDEAWSQCRRESGARGPWLFGAEYCVTDAMFAPVVLRFLTYGASLSAAAAAYVEHALTDPILREWMAAAEAEPWVNPGAEKGQP